MHNDSFGDEYNLAIMMGVYFFPDLDVKIMRIMTPNKMTDLLCHLMMIQVLYRINHLRELCPIKRDDVIRTVRD
jgi:hypothetical protein